MFSNEIENEKIDVVVESNVVEESFKEKLIRLTADFDNYKKRVERDKHSWIVVAKTEVLKKVLPFVDELQLAMNSLSEQHNVGMDVLQGLSLILNNYQKALTDLGVVEVVYDSFNPEIHEVIGFVNTPGKVRGEIVKVFKKGFMVDGHLLRHAQVMLAE